MGFHGYCFIVEDEDKILCYKGGVFLKDIDKSSADEILVGYSPIFTPKVFPDFLVNEEVREICKKEKLVSIQVDKHKKPDGSYEIEFLL